MSVTLYTVGHSNRIALEFTDLLLHAGIQSLVDVRSLPKSRHNPQFSNGTLRHSLKQVGIVYHWAGKALGGMRKPKSGSRHIAIREDSARAYADHMETAEFATAVNQMIHLAEKYRTAFMCAEKLPEQCHRNYISDYLTLVGNHVIHLIASEDSQPHVINPLVRLENDLLVYDRHISAELDLHM